MDRTYEYEIVVRWKEGSNVSLERCFTLTADLDHDKVCSMFESAGHFLGAIYSIIEE